jgi:GNAT superfamily N-acetyltransferase
MPVAISDATPRDVEAIAALHAASWRATYRGIMPDDFLDREADADRLRHWRSRMQALGPETILLKAVSGDALWAFACTFLDADGTWGALLDNLHVAPTQTGQGIGARLLIATLERVNQVRPHGRLHLWVFEANTRARRFYERLGGVLVEQKVVEVVPGVRVPELRYAWKA